jgi:hypothetical protein
MSETFKGDTLPQKEEWKPEPAESFEIEFLNTGRITQHLIDMGFVFVSSRPEGNKVIVEGKSTAHDGTKIEIIVTKGEDYRSPKEREEERAAKEQK